MIWLGCPPRVILSQPFLTSDSRAHARVRHGVLQMRLKTITRLESTTKLTRELVKALTLALGHTRAERRDLREQLVAIAADDLWEELRNRASEKKLNRKRCGAKIRRGTLCLRPALSNGRCANHGGRSTGARTEAGRLRIVEAQRRRWASWRSARDSRQGGEGPWLTSRARPSAPK